MSRIRTLTTALLLLLGASTVSGQTEQSSARQPASAQTVTISISGKGIRFASLGAVNRMRLEVFDADGQAVLDTGFQPGNVRDWPVTDAKGQRLSDGAYSCVVTVRELSGRMSLKQGIVVLQGGRPSLALDGGGQPSAAASEQSLAPQTAAEAPAMTVVAHDGKAGQVTSVSGPLTLRTGDFFSGKETERLRITEDGRVGVGTKDPQAALDVAGMIRARGGIRFDDGSTMTSAETSKATSLAVTPSASAEGEGTRGKIVRWMTSSVIGNSIMAEANNGVGVNTLPSASLHVNGVQPEPLTSAGTSAPLLLKTTGGKGGNTTGTTGQIAGAGAGIYLIAGDGGDAPAGSKRGGGGNIVLQPGVGGDGAGAAGTNGNVLIAQTGVGNVAIGTKTATSRLTVSGMIETVGAGGVKFPDGSVQDKAVTLAISGAGTAGQIVRFTGPNTFGNSAIAESAGRVGIGTATPGAKLHVAGDMKVSGNAIVAGNIAAKYQDVAEWVPSRHQMAAGTVVILDTTQSNAVAPSDRPYDTHVAGVVSAQPGVVLGEGGSGKVMVATTGRVRVKVDAGRYPVKIGDLLVTSGKPGVAMRSRPIRAGGTLIHRPGTIIGKALEPLANGEGEILVLLSLQ